MALSGWVAKKWWGKHQNVDALWTFWTERYIRVENDRLSWSDDDKRSNGSTFTEITVDGRCSVEYKKGHRLILRLPPNQHGEDMLAIKDCQLGAKDKTALSLQQLYVKLKSMTTNGGEMTSKFHAEETAKTNSGELFQKFKEDDITRHTEALKADKYKEARKQARSSRIVSAIPNEPMSTGTYKAHLIRLNVIAASDNDVDVFHIVANEHGGADHPDNYNIAQGSGYNRSIGSRFDDLNLYFAGKDRSTKAIQASMTFGNVSRKGKPPIKYVPQHSSTAEGEAHYRFQAGEALFKRMRWGVKDGDVKLVTFLAKRPKASKRPRDVAEQTMPAKVKKH